MELGGHSSRHAGLPPAPRKRIKQVRRISLYYLYFNGMRVPCESHDEVVTLLRRHGINPTRQRLRIAEALYAQAGHWSADSLYAQVSEGEPATSKATVYNTLNLLVERGLIREVIAHPNKVFYDANTSPHYHFYHVETGELTDIAPADLPIVRLPQLPDGTVAEGVDIVVRVRSAGKA
jgi:Fur family iron response transcriptional regulator